MPRDIEESDEFRTKREEIVPDAKLFDDITKGITFAIAKKPDLCALIPGSDIRVVKIRATPSTPPLSIFYRIKNDHIIELLDLMVRD